MMHLPGDEPWGDDDWGEDPDDSDANPHSHKGGGYYDLGGGGTPPRGALGWNRGRGPGAIWDAWGDRDDSVEGPLHRRTSNLSTSTRSRTKGDGYVDLGGGSPRSSILAADPVRQVAAGARERGAIRRPPEEISKGFFDGPDRPVVGEKVEEVATVVAAVPERGQEKQQPQQQSQSHEQHSATNQQSIRSRRAGSSGYKITDTPMPMYSPW